MIIEIHEREFAEDEALAKALALCARHQNVLRAEIYVSPRIPLDAEDYKNPGWIEYGVLLKYKTGGQMYVAIIQRRPGEPWESHS
jgi:hypothetical protein